MSTPKKNFSLIQPVADTEPETETMDNQAKPNAGKSGEESHFHLTISVRQDQMAQWSQEKLAAFFESARVLMMAQTPIDMPGAFSSMAHASSGSQAEITRLESAMAARLREHEATLVELQRTAVSSLEALRAQIASATSGLALVRQGGGEIAGDSVSRIGDTIASVEERIRRIEQTVDSVRRHVATLHESVAEDFKTFEDNLTTHTNAIQSAKTAMSQTDDLVERVVEALEVLQSAGYRRAIEEAGSTN
jgi:hypothetical protein